MPNEFFDPNRLNSDIERQKKEKAAKEAALSQIAAQDAPLVEENYAGYAYPDLGTFEGAYVNDESPEVSNPNQNVVNPEPEIPTERQPYTGIGMDRLAISPEEYVGERINKSDHDPKYDNIDEYNAFMRSQQPPELASTPQFSQHPLEGGNVADPYQRLIEDTFAERDATPVGPGRDAINKRLSDLRSPDAPLEEYNYAGYAAQPPEVSNPNQNIVNPNVPPVDSGRFSQHPADGSNVPPVDSGRFSQHPADGSNIPPVDSGRFSQHPADGGNVLPPIVEEAESKAAKETQKKLTGLEKARKLYQKALDKQINEEAGADFLAGLDLAARGYAGASAGPKDFFKPSGTSTKDAVKRAKDALDRAKGIGSGKLQQSGYTDKRTGEVLVFDPKRGFVGSKGVVSQKHIGQTPLKTSPERQERLRLDKKKYGRLPLKEGEKLTAFDNTLTSLNELDKIVKGGIKPGPLSSFLYKLGAKVPGNILKLEGQAKLHAIAADALGKYINSISGKQVTEQEAKRLEVVVPSASDPEGVFNAKLVQMKNLLAKFRANSLKTYKNNEYNVGAFEDDKIWKQTGGDPKIQKYADRFLGGNYLQAYRILKIKEKKGKK